MDLKIEKYISSKRRVIDKRLAGIYRPGKKKQSKLKESIRYSLLANGKRLRPILCLASCESFGGLMSHALPVACAIEMIHTYSLIHDDLPSMDDDNLRRGVPTNHVVYGESAAILAGDALMTDSFGLIVDECKKKEISTEIICELISLLSKAAGSEGMVEGQAIDLEFSSTNISVDDLKKLHSLKTGALISASVVSGAIVAGAKKEEIKFLKKFSDSIGLAFQIKDDLIDDTGAGKTGKSGGSDRKNKKSTYLTELGEDKSLALIDNLTAKSSGYLDSIDRDTTILKELARYLGKRNR